MNPDLYGAGNGELVKNNRLLGNEETSYSDLLCLKMTKTQLIFRDGILKAHGLF